tara:strand:+ start:2174 stop:2821 length:648 start_codon:yes stop_codon:yes gene_type:complete
MGVTFEGKIRIVKSLPNPPEFQDKTTEAKVGLILTRNESVYIHPSDVHAHNLQLNDVVIAKYGKSRDGRSIPYGVLEILETVWSSENEQKKPCKQVVKKEVSYEQMIMKTLMIVRCMEFKDLWVRVTSIVDTRFSDLNEDELKKYYAVQDALKEMYRKGRVFKISCFRNKEGDQDKASHTFYGRTDDPSVFQDILNMIDPEYKKRNKYMIGNNDE